MPDTRTYLTLRSATGELLPDDQRRSPPYTMALGLARNTMRRRELGFEACEQAHIEGQKGTWLGTHAQACAEAWREAECLALHDLDQAGHPPAAGTHMTTGQATD